MGPCVERKRTSNNIRQNFLYALFPILGKSIAGVLKMRNFTIYPLPSTAIVMVSGLTLPIEHIKTRLYKAKKEEPMVKLTYTTCAME